MEYFFWLLTTFTEIEPKFNYGLCRQLDQFFEQEERLSGDELTLWEHCNETEYCEKLIMKYYQTRWTCYEHEVVYEETEPVEDENKIPICE